MKPVSVETMDAIRAKANQPHGGNGKDYHMEHGGIKPTNSNPIDALRALEVTVESIKKIQDTKFIINDLLAAAAINTWVAPPESGKTALARYAAKAAAGLGYEIFYFDVDSPASVTKEMKILADKEGWMYFNPDVMLGQSVEIYLKILRDIANSGEDLHGKLFILDTMKKFTDSINNKDANKRLTSLARALAARGAAVLFLGHTIKYRDKDDNLVPEGTNEVMTDVDTLIIFEVEKDTSRGVLTATTITDRTTNPYVKNRFAFEPISFQIALAKRLEDRTVTLLCETAPTVEHAKNRSRMQKDKDVIEAIKKALNFGCISQKSIIASCLGDEISKRKTVAALKAYSVETRLMPKSWEDGQLWSAEDSKAGHMIEYRLLK